ncbi:hypothetical protein TNIN_298331 [Trichonephila inaurata madagascariensis]|uniref:Uncharacterized protein n=1 Tax=Trichonephila inaurata madagascariensis TaxID=2747483 RepID=A0A8X6MD83_9ARAC|nr:hypothetical protein TNIN_298331 [Trichonephila inaurata madagascariensis]
MARKENVWFFVSGASAIRSLGCTSFRIRNRSRRVRQEQCMPDSVDGASAEKRKASSIGPQPQGSHQRRALRNHQSGYQRVERRVFVVVSDRVLGEFLKTDGPGLVWDPV